MNQFLPTIVMWDGWSNFSSLLIFHVKPNLYFYYKIAHIYIGETIQVICIKIGSNVGVARVEVFIDLDKK